MRSPRNKPAVFLNWGDTSVDEKSLDLRPERNKNKKCGDDGPLIVELD